MGMSEGHEVRRSMSEVGVREGKRTQKTEVDLGWPDLWVGNKTHLTKAILHYPASILQLSLTIPNHTLALIHISGITPPIQHAGLLSGYASAT